MATYHQLPQFFEQRRAQLSHLRDLDAAILVSSNQKRFFDIILGPSRVHIIPHGIDTEFFHPPTDSHKDERPLRCLTVGSNYRDMDLHAQVIRNINRSSLRDVEFVVIGEPRCTDSFVGLDNVTYLSGISDEELLRFYQTTHVLLLPLADATACNALLEGMACGSPILVTDVGGVRDYVDDASAALVPARDPDAMTERLIGLLKDENCREELGARARQRALVRFDWRIIAQQVRQVHAKISAQ